MWCDHPLSQRNRTTKRTVGVGVGGDREVCVCVCVCVCVGVGVEGGGVWIKFASEGGRQYRGSS